MITLKQVKYVRRSTPDERSGDTGAEWWWVVSGERYASKKEAAEALNVSRRTIQNWCNGYARRGKTIPPKKDCYVIAK